MILVGDDKVQELLLKLLEDMSYVKAKLDSIDAQKLSSRVDLLEAQSREQERAIKQLENRNSTLEEFIRTNMNDNNKANKALWTSIGLAIFSVILNIFVNLL